MALVHRGTSTITIHVSLQSRSDQISRHTVEDSLGLVGKEGDVTVDQLQSSTRSADILERRDDLAILLNEHSVFKSVGGLEVSGMPQLHLKRAKRDSRQFA